MSEDQQIADDLNPESADISEEPEASPEPPKKRRRFAGRGRQLILAIVVVLVLLNIFVMAINYSFPGYFTPEHKDDDPKGLVYTDTLIAIGDELFSNWLPNDHVWPTIFLDNPQNFQLGALEAMRYSVRVMRDKLTKLRTTAQIDPNCEKAMNLLANDEFKWILPSAESRYKDAIDELRAYRARLLKGEAGFYPRADNLSEMLDQYVSLLGSVNTSLSNAPKSQRYKLSEEGAGESYVDQPEQLVDTYVPWSKIDDNFYYAQGVAYVIRQVMLSIKYDFAEILAVKKASNQIDSILEVLNQAQFEPLLVLNGGVGSIMANHSMELHSILENARQKIRNLNDMLRQ